jgi:hypothetical protein
MISNASLCEKTHRGEHEGKGLFPKALSPCSTVLLENSRLTLPNSCGSSEAARVLARYPAVGLEAGG